MLVVPTVRDASLLAVSTAVAVASTVTLVVCVPTLSPGFTVLILFGSKTTSVCVHISKPGD